MKRLTERKENGVINVRYATEHETAIHRLAAIEEILGDEYELGDIAPIRHAHWFDIGSLSCRCSRCGRKYDRETAHCPNCGAKMNGMIEMEANLTADAVSVVRCWECRHYRKHCWLDGCDHWHAWLPSGAEASTFFCGDGERKEVAPAPGDGCDELEERVEEHTKEHADAIENARVQLNKEETNMYTKKFSSILDVISHEIKDETVASWVSQWAMESEENTREVAEAFGYECDQ